MAPWLRIASQKDPTFWLDFNNLVLAMCWLAVLLMISWSCLANWLLLSIEGTCGDCRLCTWKTLASSNWWRIMNEVMKSCQVYGILETELIEEYGILNQNGLAKPVICALIYHFIFCLKSWHELKLRAFILIFNSQRISQNSADLLPLTRPS